MSDHTQTHIYPGDLMMNAFAFIGATILVWLTIELVWNYVS